MTALMTLEFSNSPIVGRDRAPSYFTRISNNTSSNIFSDLTLDNDDAT